MYKIGTLNKIAAVGLNQLTDNYKLTNEIEEANGIIVRSAKMHDMEFSDNLLAIARAGAGVNNIPVDRCAEEGIVVFNAPGANANAVKELVLAGMLLATRNIPAAIEWASALTEDVSGAVEKGKSQFAGTEIAGKTLGVIGLGAIGVLVANAADRLGMNVIGYDPYFSVKSAHSLRSDIPVVRDLAQLLPKCDFVTIHVPAMDGTKGMMNAERFAQMKEGAVLLNFARDTLVNDDDLVEALATGTPKVYVTDFPNGKVLNKPGVIATPHLGASTAEAEDNCAIMAAKELMDYIENGNISNSVNYPTCSMGVVADEASRICVLSKNDPAIVADLTGLLAKNGIATLSMAHGSKGNYACTLIDIERKAGTEALATEIGAIEGTTLVRILA